MKKIAYYLKPYKKEVWLAIFFMCLDVLSEIIQPQLMAAIVGKGIQSKNLSYIVMIGIIMIIFSGISIIGGIGNSKFSAKSGVGFAANLRKGLFSKVQTFSFKNIDDFSTASLSTRLTNDVTQLQNTVIMGLRICVKAPLMFIFALLMAISLNASLAVILAIVIPVIIIALGTIIYKVMPLFQKLRKCLDGLNASVQENVTNVRVVKSFVREEYEKQKFYGTNDKLMKSSFEAINIVIFNMPIMMFAMNSAIVAVLWFGGSQVIHGTLDVASMTAFINYIFMILMSLMVLSMIFIMVTQASASYKRILEVLNTVVDLEDEASAKDVELIQGEVEFKNVSFKYNLEQDETILENINFKAHKGEVVAIIGGTGSGKSSLVQLIPRLYDVTSGEILIDGKNLIDYTIESLRNNIGMVLQKNTLFSGTIRDNLKWGNLNATDEEIIEAAKNAQAHDFIMGFPDGYDTWIDQGGVNVSGGQKQRLCIARAMLKKPPILILDDSTSAVDTATEGKIRTAFSTTLKDTTTFIIAQRISSVQDADKIIVLEDGKIVGLGTHEELLESNEEYQEIYNSQQRKEVNA
ncbi:ABC transporter ATP-binding protein [Inconstantimicrobium mannanitabidum]|uniref:ABC transporter n=1 Tax=Inconstantimicrobium mannanitabidum TaxID=1604901 RepID=A0ACB5R7V5_9CLOT|nr:ABC transporter ATP-binding protein [Clostridium sp. TW13]GKX65041.1 ABC transporter [Clostridium sp. TW13]